MCYFDFNVFNIFSFSTLFVLHIVPFILHLQYLILENFLVHKHNWLENPTSFYLASTSEQMHLPCKD